MYDLAAGDVASPAKNNPAAVSVAGDKEFDPITNQKSADESTVSQNKVMSSFGISNDTGTRSFVLCGTKSG